MDWTVNCFKWKERSWREIAEGEKRAGHRAYAWKQTSMWETWAKTAADIFKSLKGC